MLYQGIADDVKLGKDVKVFNPAFDVTPHHLITAIITEKEVVREPFNIGLQKITS